MDYEATDREMSCWLVTSEKNGTRFYLTDENLATDRLDRAKRFRWQDDAEAVAACQSADKAWSDWGFHWTAISRASAAPVSSLAGFYPDDWHRCPSCGDFALDGKRTCGRAQCL